ncbi:MAG: hypothetical protein ABI162_12355 [Luteolibacter sp.]
MRLFFGIYCVFFLIARSLAAQDVPLSCSSPNGRFSIDISPQPDGSRNVVLQELKGRKVSMMIASEVSRVKIESLWRQDSKYVIAKLNYGTKMQEVVLIYLGGDSSKSIRILDEQGKKFFFDDREFYFLSWEKDGAILRFVEIKNGDLSYYRLLINNERSNTATVKYDRMEKVPIEEIESRVEKFRQKAVSLPALKK